jgi:undecaprenyl-diphosphatase
LAWWCGPCYGWARLLRVSSPWPRRLQRFTSRHRWSLPLALASTLFFARWAGEMRELQLEPFDAAVASAIAQTRGHWDWLMLNLTRLGEGEALLVLLGSISASLLATRRRREVAFLLTIGGGTLLLNALLKLAFARARPDVAELYLITTPHSFSFPSGHALGSTTVLFGLVVVARVIGVRGMWLGCVGGCAALLVLGVSASRVYFGVHFPSDVIGGMFAGAGWVSAVAGWFYPRVLPGEEVPPAEAS